MFSDLSILLRLPAVSEPQTGNNLPENAAFLNEFIGSSLNCVSCSCFKACHAREVKVKVIWAKISILTLTFCTKALTWALTDSSQIGLLLAQATVNFDAGSGYAFDRQIHREYAYICPLPTPWPIPTEVSTSNEFLSTLSWCAQGRWKPQQDPG